MALRMLRFVAGSFFVLSLADATLLVRQGEKEKTIGKAVPSDAQAAAVRTVKAADIQKAMAHTAASEAITNEKGLLVTQQGIVSDMAKDAAEEMYDKQRAVVPASKAALNEARVFAFRAKKSAEHAAVMADEMKRIPMEAAEYAVTEIQKQIVTSAYKAAEAAAAAPPMSEEERQKMIQEGVDAYAAPFHKKYTDAYELMKQTFMMAKSCAKQVDPMRRQATSLANAALKTQAGGKVLQAQMQMQQAHTILHKASKLKAWAEKLYAQANTVFGALSTFQAREAEARGRAFAELSAPVSYGRPIPSLETLGLAYP